MPQENINSIFLEEMSKNDEKDKDKTFYDFQTEKPWVFFVFGHAEKRSTLYKTYIAITYIVCLFLMTMTCYGMYQAGDRPEVVIFSIHVLMNATFFIWGQTTRLFTDSNVKTARQFIIDGFYRYPDEELDARQKKILTDGMFEIRISCGLLICAVSIGSASNLLYFPISQYIRVEQEEYEGLVDLANPYLPHSFYIPFSTRTPWGFFLAFILNVVFQLYTYGVAVAMNEVYVSCWVQLKMQLKILNHSLRNIQQRAYSMHQKNKTAPNAVHCEVMLHNKALQACFYQCLRANVQHHQTLLRFKKAVVPYIGSCLLLIVLIASMTFATLLALIMMNPPLNLFIHYLVLLISENSYTFYLCYFGEQVLQESAALFGSSYSMPWFECNKSFNRVLHIFMSNLKHPITLKSLLLDFFATLETYGVII